MILLSFLSGLINLSSQLVYQKIISMLVGDLYTVFIASTLIFILGSAIGSILGSFARRYLPWIELGAGIYNILIFFLIKRTLFDIEIPLAVILIGIFIPALALGTHIPLYSYYFRNYKFSLVFCLYHLGGALGLLAIEWYFTNAGSVSLSALGLGGIQVGLGCILIFYQYKKLFQANSTPMLIPRSDWKELYLIQSMFSVFFACVLSFYGVSWAVKTQLLLTESFRLQATCISIAIFTWMAVAGSVKRLVKFSSDFLFIGLALSFLLIKLSFSLLTLRLSDFIAGDLAQYYTISTILATFLTLPVLWSSLIFIKEAEKLSLRYSVDVSSGALNLFAGLGSLGGFLLAHGFAAWFWQPTYFALAIFLAGFGASIISKRKGKVAFLALLIVVVYIVQPPFTESLFTNRIPPDSRSCHRYTDIQVFSHPQTSLAILKSEYKETNDCEYRSSGVKYIIDGHLSHDLSQGIEIFVGAATGMYFSGPLKKALVIGVGSGQSAFGTASISESTDLVEISPIVISNLNYLREYNFDILNDKSVNFILRDGFNQVRLCTPGSYDLILNTSTYASSFNAAKLYSEEFANLAARCLTKQGVYHTYFDYSTAQTPAQVHEFLAPISRHFKYIDIFAAPYPQVFAYNDPKVPSLLSFRNFKDKKAGTVILENMEQSLELKALTPNDKSNCLEYYAGITSSDLEEVSISSLDKPILERNSVRNIIRSINANILPDDRETLRSTFPGKRSCLDFNLNNNLSL